MIESLSLSKVATYPEAPEVMNGLKSLNFIFGSNGTGKTTIGRVIAEPTMSPTCTTSWKGGTPLQTLVYNRDFVDRNFKPSEDLKGVFTLGEQLVGTLEKIAELKSERDSLTKKIEGWNEALHGMDGAGGKRKEVSTLDSVFKEKCWAQKVKHDAKLQGGFEGVRNSSEKFKDRVLENVKNVATLLSLDELTKKATTVFGQTPVGEPLVGTIDTEELLAHESNPILKRKVIGKSDVDIAAMINKLGNSDWVKEGRSYFDENGTVCPFCQQSTEVSFEKSLNEYFDETFLKDTQSIHDLATNYKTDSERLQQQLSLIIATPGNFLDVTKLKEEKELLDSKLTINDQRIAAKRKESSQPVELEAVGNVITAINSLISSANVSIAEHNSMVKNLSSEKKTLTAQVWRFVNEELKADIAAYQATRGNLEKAIKGLDDQIQQATRDRTTKVSGIRELERQTTSVQPTVDAINQLLLSFGFHGFSIANVPATTFYKLVRDDGTAAMKTMSEGEKTFVTFLYFFQLIKGSDTESGMTNDRVVVFDDPVSSLDSDILFIVGSLIKGLFEEVRAKKGHIKQVFVLTHNVYFHKEVTYRSKRGKSGKAYGDESFWIVRKSGRVTKIEPHAENPIKTSYELLWGELRRPDRSNLTIQNTLRRILENYFKILGNVDPDDICAKFDGRERLICRSLFSWVNDGSHFANDDIFVSDGAAVDTYLKVFKDVFFKLHHDAHYRMMMREDDDEAPPAHHAMSPPHKPDASVAQA
jgi:wobble nucleotide-excising tRNase